MEKHMIANANLSMALTVAICLLLSGCRTTRQTQTVATIPDHRAALLDNVIGDWLAAVDARRVRQTELRNRPRVVVLLASNLPTDYRPNIKGWTIIRVEQSDPEAPPSQVRVGQTEYQFNYRSIHVVKQSLATVRRLGEAPPLPITQTIEVDDPIVLRIDQLNIRGDSAEVKISQNRHYNLGGSGTTYTAQRIDGVWQCRNETTWMS
jgi:hypothetical protein